VDAQSSFEEVYLKLSDCSRELMKLDLDDVDAGDEVEGGEGPDLPEVQGRHLLATCGT